MKSLFKLRILLVVTLLFSLISCGKEDSKPLLTDEELIGSGIAWKLNTVTANGSDVSSLIDDCVVDNLITFYAKSGGNTGVVDEGASKCDTTDPQTTDFTWTYNDATSILTFNSNIIDVPGSDGEITVVSVNENELMLSQDIKIAGFTQTVLLKLIH